MSREVEEGCCVDMGAVWIDLDDIVLRFSKFFDKKCKLRKHIRVQIRVKINLFELIELSIGTL